MNLDYDEINKFEKLANKWWDKNSEFKPLHDINPLRLDYIEKYLISLEDKKILDVGCGGGILAESFAQKGAYVTGIDASEINIKIAKNHALNENITIDYKATIIENLALKEQEKYDAITCLEVLEHVPQPQSIIKSLKKVLKPSGLIFLSTINRNIKSFLYAIVGAEYILNILPKGTHKFSKLIKPSEIDKWARDIDLKIINITGMSYNPITKSYKLSNNVDVNYLCCYKK